MLHSRVHINIRHLLACLLLPAILFQLPCPAWAQQSADHQLLTGMNGFTASQRSVQEFGVAKALFIAGGHVADRTGVDHDSAEYEGRVTTVDYVIEPGKQSSEVAIYRNYLAAVQQLGGKQLNHGFDANDPMSHVTGAHVFALSSSQYPTILLLNITSGYRYQLVFVEPQKMEQSVKAEQLADDIKARGFATLYINFDTNKSDLKADGVSAVTEIATLLKSEPTLKLSIEGHTDNVGSTGANKKLSADRAQSVMKATIAQGIDAKRLVAKGFGSEVPIADNRTEEGRAKNRRVELVKQK